MMWYPVLVWFALICWIPGSSSWENGDCIEDDKKRILRESKADEYDVQILNGWGDSMTRDLCKQGCKSVGYKYAGVESSNQCFCGNYIRTHEVKNQKDCDKECKGNEEEMCGGSWRINVFDITSYEISNLNEACMVDTSSRILGKQIFTSSDDKSQMTPKYCMAGCRSLRYKWAGVESGNQCFCGNSFQNVAIKSPNGGCSNGCKGDSSQYCGGGWRLTLYKTGGYTRKTEHGSCNCAEPCHQDDIGTWCWLKSDSKSGCGKVLSGTRYWSKAMCEQGDVSEEQMIEEDEAVVADVLDAIESA